MAAAIWSAPVAAPTSSSAIEGGDTVIGGSGPDRLVGGDGGDLLKGKNGRDRLKGNARQRRPQRRQEAGPLQGRLGPDTLNAAVGRNSLPA